MMANALSAITWAMENAESLPEKCQVAAFVELLRHALAAGSFPVEPTVAESSAISAQTASEISNGSLPEEYWVKEKGSRDQQTVWAVMLLHGEGKSATVASVMDVIRERLGATTESRSNTSARLKTLTPRYLTRRQGASKTYEYMSKARAAEIFEGLGE